MVVAADGPCRPARRAGPVARRGFPHPHRHDDLAHHGAPDRGAEAATTRRCSGIGGSRFRAMPSAPVRCSPTASRLRWCRNSTRSICLLTIDSDLSRLRAWAPALCPRFRRAPKPGPHRSHEPSLCDRADADADRRRGGSSLHRQPARSGADRPGAGRGGDPQRNPGGHARLVRAAGRGPEGGARPDLHPCRSRPAGRNPRVGPCDERGAGRPRRDLHADRSGGG